MFKKQAKMECQSSSIRKLDKQQILQYVICFGNHITVCTHHIDFNSNFNAYDRNSTAYVSCMTGDGWYLLIFGKDPHSIHILHVKSGEIFVVRGLEQLINVRIIAVAVQPAAEVKQGSQTRKLNIIYENQSSIYFKVIQFQPIIDITPKSRLKVIQQNIQYQNQELRADPIFSAITWNNFILCRRQVLRVCRGIKKNEDVSFNYAVQVLEHSLHQVFQRVHIIGMAESSFSWGILCGNSYNSRGDQKMTVNIFEQHYHGNQLGKNMYYRDSSFVKNVELECTERHFVKFWFCNGCYLVETRVGNCHQCHVIPENAKFGLVTLKLLQKSEVCYHSLNISEAEVSICEIVNRKQLFKTKLSDKSMGQQHISSNTSTGTASTNAIPMNNNSQQNKNESRSIQTKREIQTSIKQFAVVPQKKDNEEKQSSKEQGKQGKNTIKKVDNSVSVEMTEKIPERKDNLIKKTESEILQTQTEVPEKLKRTYSFGTQDELFTKQPVESNKNSQNHVQQVLVPTNVQVKKQTEEKSNVVVSNAVVPTKSQMSETNKTKLVINAKEQKKQVAVVEKSKAKQIVDVFSTLVKLMNEELMMRQNQLGSVYSIKANGQSLIFQQILSKQEQKLLLHLQKSFVHGKCALANKNNRRKIVNGIEKRNKEKIKQSVERCQQLLRKIQVNCLEDMMEMKCLRKVTKKRSQPRKVESVILREVEEIGLKFQQIELKVENIFKKENELFEKWENKKKKEKKSLNLKDIMKVFNGNSERKDKEKKFVMRVPIPRRQLILNENPMIKLVPC